MAAHGLSHELIRLARDELVRELHQIDVGGPTDLTPQEVELLRARIRNLEVIIRANARMRAH